MTATLEEIHEPEVKSLMQGKVMVIHNRPKSWWDERIRNGFFSFLEEAEVPVRVLGRSKTYHFNTGLDKHKLRALLRVRGESWSEYQS